MTPADAQAAIALFGVDPRGLGLVLRGGPGPARDAILAAIAASAGLRLHRVPAHVQAERLSGGLDLGATLSAGRPIRTAGLLAEYRDGVLVMAMAERWDERRAAQLATAMDQSGGPGVIALDEGLADDERPSARIRDRCALHLVLADLPANFTCAPDPAAIAAARARLQAVEVDEDIITALCNAAIALGIFGLRAVLHATRLARAAAALAARARVNADDAALAARLVLSPLARQVPAPEEQEEETRHDQDDAAEPPPAPPNDPDSTDGPATESLDDIVLDAAKTALPADLLASLAAAPAAGRASPGKSGLSHGTYWQGRPLGDRPGVPRGAQRLDIIATLRSAAPWQRLRGRAAPTDKLRIARDDLRIQRCRPRTGTTTIFAVDASGSQAMARLAETKGAVELLLADCYVRRDHVAVIAFRGTQASLLLPPTRAPARARRSLAALPGGGGTPLASGIDAAVALADAAVARGESPAIVLLTDGQANVSRSGAPGRPPARQDAMDAARALRARGHRCLLIDTAPRRQPLAMELASAMGGRYLALPRVDAESVSAAVRAGRPK